LTSSGWLSASSRRQDAGGPAGRDAGAPKGNGRSLWLLALLLGVSFACARTNISRQQWHSMPPAKKVLYVRTLIGHQQAQAAKEGNDRVFPAAPEEYVKRIDAAYAQGDQRTADAIFEDLGVRR